MKDRKIRLIDCTLRDGGNFNNWLFTDRDINIVVEKLDEAGLDIIEVGYIGGSGSNKEKKVGQAAYCSKEFLERLPITKQASLAVMVVPSVCSINDLQELDSSLIKWVRVASYPHNVKNALPFVQYLKNKGFKVAMNLMAASYCSTEEIQNISKLFGASGVDVFYLADSYGAMTPDDVANRIQVSVEVAGCPIGFHGHNNLGLAFVNALEAINSGASYIDTSLCGMARGAGNLPTEQFISAMKRWGKFKDKYNIQPILQASDYVLHSILQTPMRISTPEIVCGLSNVHYYYYELVNSKCKEYGLNTLEISEKIGELFPHKVDTLYVDKIINQFINLNGEVLNDEKKEVTRTTKF